MSIVLMSDPRVAAIPVAENGDPLADVRACEELLLDDRRSDPAYAFAHLRSGVLDRLLQAQLLLPEGLRLLVVEGFRPPALQQRYFEEYAAELRAAHGDWPAEELRAQASRYVSPPEIAPQQRSQRPTGIGLRVRLPDSSLAAHGESQTASRAQMLTAREGRAQGV